MTETPRPNPQCLAGSFQQPGCAAERFKSELAALRERLEGFRDTVLYQRGALAENGMTNDQINDVLREFDDAIAGGE